MEFHFNKRQHSFSTTELRQRIITLEHQKQEAAKVVKADTYAGPASITLTQNVT
jgi:hypothetical protein